MFESARDCVCQTAPEQAAPDEHDRGSANNPLTTLEANGRLTLRLKPV